MHDQWWAMQQEAWESASSWSHGAQQKGGLTWSLTSEQSAMLILKQTWVAVDDFEVNEGVEDEMGCHAAHTTQLPT